MQAAQAEEMRELAERGRVESDSVRSEQLAQVLSAVATMRMEHDGMLEGALLLRRRVRAGVRACGRAGVRVAARLRVRGARAGRVRPGRRRG